VIVIQEWWGLVDHIKDVCDRFADEGFVALAPDLYHGKSTKSPDEAGKLMMALHIDQAGKDLGAAVQYLLTLGFVPARRLVLWFLHGWRAALYTATKNQNIGACVVFYGGHPKVKPDLAELACASVRSLREKGWVRYAALSHESGTSGKRSGKQIEVKIYKTRITLSSTTRGQKSMKREASADAWLANDCVPAPAFIRVIRVNLWRVI
jgi:carboxymethylenebutenolidase